MAYYDALKTEWAALAGTTAEKLAALNALTVAGPAQDVPASSVLGYLALAGKLSALQAYAANPPAGANASAALAARELFAVLAMPAFAMFATSEPPVYAALSGWLAAFVADTALTGFAAADEAALLALAATQTPWWKANGYSSPFNANDLAAAGGLT